MSTFAGRNMKLVSSLLQLWVCIICYILITSLSDETLTTSVADINSSMGDSHNKTARNRCTLAQIRHHIRQLNTRQIVYNLNSFGPLTNNSLVLVIQVNDRSTYLADVIHSLSLTKGIENSLLIFSHNYYDSEINTVVKSIDFCKVLQIYYPYPIQTHYNIFPDDSPTDCSTNSEAVPTGEAVLEMSYPNSLPDLLGQYQKAKFVQMKFNWWWKMNYIFNQLGITKDFVGNFVFLEDDHYVLPDFIHILHLMDATRLSKCSGCQILSLGKHLSTVDVDFATNTERIEIATWQNIGMVFRRSVWLEIKACANIFWTHDDYHWDSSLLAVSEKCLVKKLTALILLAPRIYHIGECNIFSRQDCSTNSTSTLSSVRAMLRVSEDYLFPEELVVVDHPSEGPSASKDLLV